MTGYRPFKELTKGFSEAHQARVAARVSEMKTEMALHASGQARAPDGQIGRNAPAILAPMGERRDP
jgi:hypothetical protein